MKRSRFTEEQIIGILKEQESGLKVSNLFRKHGISDATFYKWKTRYGGLEVSEAIRHNTTIDEAGFVRERHVDRYLKLDVSRFSSGPLRPKMVMKEIWNGTSLQGRVQTRGGAFGAE